MCTLILGRDVLGAGTVLLAANRDERADRASEAPVVLHDAPLVAGGRDQAAGGTWLAVREGRAVIAILNRRAAAGAAAARDRRSRGLLALDVATAPEGFHLELDPVGERREILDRIRAVAGDELGAAALARAFAALWDAAYAPFSLVFASPGGAWVLGLEAGGKPRVRAVPEGWHVITHAELDDESEPRTARLLYELAYYRPLSVEKALQRAGDLLRSHGAGRGAVDPRPVPAVCLHEGLMGTVSSSMVFLQEGGCRYLHAEGRPCQAAFTDRSALLVPRRRELAAG